MIGINLDPTQRGGAIIPAGSPALTLLNAGVVYAGPCPICQKRTIIDHNIDLCKACWRVVYAHIVRPPSGAAYLRLLF